jgi:hypothetical protein
MAEPAGPISDEKVAAIDAPRHFDPVPMVIRGGIVGDAYGSGGGPQTHAEPAPETASADKGGSTGGPASPAPDEPQQPDLGPPPALGKPR